MKDSSREEPQVSAQWLAMAEPSVLPLGERLKQLRQERGKPS
jgi:hypothetical protein